MSARQATEKRRKELIELGINRIKFVDNNLSKKQKDRIFDSFT